MTIQASKTLEIDPLTLAVKGGLYAPRVAGAGAMDAPARVELIDASTIKPEPVRWLWPGWLARGKLHVIAGAPGTGKTTAVLSWAASVTACKTFPSGWRLTKPGRVLVWSGEDDPADTLVPRLQAAGADLSRVQIVGDVMENGERFAFDPARDVPTLAAALAAQSDVAMIVIDPLVSAVGGDSHKNAEVRRSLAPLVELAQRMDAALVGITHYSKGTQGREPLERVSGSLAFGALARLVFGTVRQKAEDEAAPPDYLLARVKSNIGPDGGGFGYAFEQTDNGQGIITSRVVWGAAVDGSARDLIGSAEADPDDGDSGAAGFLRDLLANGPMATRDVYRDAEGNGYSRDQMKRAKVKIGAEAVKVGGYFGDKGAHWEWGLPALKRAQNAEERGQNCPLPSGKTAPFSTNAADEAARLDGHEEAEL